MPRPKPPTFDHSPTSLPPDHILVHLGAPQGSNNFQSISPDGIARLVELSSKLRGRGSVLVARGDFAFVALFPPDPTGSKVESRVMGEIVKVLNGKEVRDFKRGGEWPQGFGDPEPQPEPAVPPTPRGEDEGYESDEDEEPQSDEDDLDHAEQ